LKNELEQNRDVYCPWMVIALYFLTDSNPNTLEKFNSLITKWASDDLKRVYQNAIKHYIPDNNRRLIPRKIQILLRKMRDLSTSS